MKNQLEHNYYMHYALHNNNKSNQQTSIVLTQGKGAVNWNNIHKQICFYFK